MRKPFLPLVCGALAAAGAAIAIPFIAAPVQASPTLAVAAAGPTQLGGAIGGPDLTLFDSISRTPAFSVFTQLMVDGDLTDTLSGPDAYTVFAVPDEVFHKMPDGTVGKLNGPNGKREAVKVAAYHVIKGRLTSGEIFDAIERSGGEKAMFRTVQGENLTFSRSGQVLLITDANGDLTDITVADIPQANGVVHIVDHPLTPR